MESHILKVKSVVSVTHNVLQIKTERPSGYSFKSGQATKVGVNKPGWEEKKRPFTFTNLPEEDHLEFTIKTYPSHEGVTNEIQNLKEGDELIVGASWGAIHYYGEGLFIAGGAGVTPFISIFRDLHSQHKVGANKLIFANDKVEDIINKEEFEKILGNNFINVLSKEEKSGYEHGYITSGLLKSQLADGTKYVYLCGPPPMMKAVEKMLIDLKVDPKNIIQEKF